MTHRLTNFAPEPKRQVAVTDAHHNDPALLAGDELVAEVVGFLDAWIGQQ